MNCRSSEYDQLLATVLWQTYEDVSTFASKTGIRYGVVLDPRIRQLIEVSTYPSSHAINRVLVPLAFLLSRFETMTQFRFTIGRDENRIPIFATFHSNDSRGDFVALTYEDGYR